MSQPSRAPRMPPISGAAVAHLVRRPVGEGRQDEAERADELVARPDDLVDLRSFHARPLPCEAVAAPVSIPASTARHRQPAQRQNGFASAQPVPALEELRPVVGRPGPPACRAPSRRRAAPPGRPAPAPPARSAPRRAIAASFRLPKLSCSSFSDLEVGRDPAALDRSAPACRRHSAASSAPCAARAGPRRRARGCLRPRFSTLRWRLSRIAGATLADRRGQPLGLRIVRRRQPAARPR